MNPRNLISFKPWRLTGGADEVEPVEPVEAVEPGEPLSFRQKVQKKLKTHWLLVWLMTAVIVGVIIGFLLRLRPTPYSKREVMYASFLGILLLRLLQCIAVPLFTSSIMAALGQLNMQTSGKICIRTIVYFLTTSYISSVLGIIMVIIMQPGARKQNLESTAEIKVRQTYIVDSALDIIRNLFPSNLVEAWLYTHSTALIPPENTTKTVPMSEWDFEPNQLVPGVNFMGLVTFSAAIGIAIGYMGERVQEFTYFIERMNDIFLNLTFFTVKIAPPGICCLIIGQIIELEDVAEAISQVGMYTLCCILGFFLIALVILPCIYVLFLRKSPLRFLYKSLTPAVTAFATASSLATLPTTLKCVEEEMHIDHRISRFVIPLGATANMNGSALYNAAGPLFLAQLAEVDITLAHYLALSVIATVASVGVAAVPQGAIITMVLVLSVVNVPAEMIGIAYTMDWLLDRVLTSVNVMGDIVASEIIQHLSQAELDSVPPYDRHQQADKI